MDKKVLNGLVASMCEEATVRVGGGCTEAEGRAAIGMALRKLRNLLVSVACGDKDLCESAAGLAPALPALPAPAAAE